MATIAQKRNREISRGGTGDRKRLDTESLPSPLATTTEGYASDDDRWRAFVERDPAADGAFYICVRTTGIYCRNVCPARRPRRENIEFHATIEAAEAAGFRPCKRCQPKEKSMMMRRADAVAAACRMIEASTASAPSLADLARSVGLSEHHFHRIFKATTGVTPKAYASAHRAGRLRHELKHRSSVAEAALEAGFQSLGPFYETSSGVLGMTPKSFRAGAKGLTIRYALRGCWLGSILVAATEVGVCAILLGDDKSELIRELEERFPNATFAEGDATFDAMVANAVALVETPSRGVDLPLDIRGTAFQHRVWAELQRIPPGATATYTEIAGRIGQPAAVRAVGSACAANPVAVAIPCHRVVRTDGSLAGYYWGVEMKARLLEHERENE